MNLHFKCFALGCRKLYSET